MNEPIIKVDQLSSADKSELTEFQSDPAWPRANPPEQGWPLVAPPPVSFLDWKSSQPIIKINRVGET
jgi:hypothetical protein